VGQTNILEEEMGSNSWWKHRHRWITGGTCTDCPHPKSLRLWRNEV